MSVHSASRRKPISPTRPNGVGKEDKRRRILDAAVTVFAQKGFFHARVNDISREAGVADGTIYLYFANKDDLLISLFEDRMDGVIGAFRAELPQHVDAAMRLRRFIELHLQMVESDPTLAEVLTVELRQSAKFMREYRAAKFAEYLDILAEVVAFGQQRGELRADMQPRLVARILFGALDEVSLAWASDRRERPEMKEALKQAAQEIWHLCAHGVFTAPPTTPERPAAGENA